MSLETACPEQMYLQRLVLGEASTVEAAELQAHLKHCEACGAVVDGKGGGRTLNNEGTAEESEFDSAPLVPVPEADPDETDQLTTARKAQSGDSTTDPGLTGEFVPSGSPNETGDYEEPGGLLAVPVSEALSSDTHTLEGEVVPGYEILEELGRGGMGVVYKARHLRLQRIVALKMILAGAHAGAVGLARFRAEAEAAARLQHPNIVQIYETGEHEGRPFFSLEFVPGGSLEQRMQEKRLTPQESAELVATLARTMDAAHQRGIVHRDLKPANILLSGEGREARGESRDSPPLRSRLLSQRLPTSAWPSGWTTILRKRKAAPSWARPVTWPRSRRPAGPKNSVLPRTPTPWARCCTSFSPAGRRSRPAIRSIPSVRSSSKTRCRRASWSRACPLIWKRFV